MMKPTYYLWEGPGRLAGELCKEEEKYRKAGFRVVVLRDGPKEKDIKEGIKAVIQNHCS